MTTLKPLRDDPATAGALRRALQSEAELPTLIDAAAVKAAVLGQVATGAGVATAKAALGGGLAAKAALAGTVLIAATGGVLWWQAATPSTRDLRPAEPTARPSPPPIALPVAEAPPATPPAALPSPDPAAAPADPPPRVAPVTPRPRPPLPTPRPAAPAASPVEVALDALPAAPAEADTAATPSLLEAQLALYDRGRQALQRGALAEAAGLFEDYLANYPGGALEVEASLSLLEASMRAGQHARVATLASALARRGTFAGRRGELLRAQGEALARLGRCDEAERVLTRALDHADARLGTRQVEAALATCRAAEEPLP